MNSHLHRRIFGRWCWTCRRRHTWSEWAYIRLDQARVHAAAARWSGRMTAPDRTMAELLAIRHIHDVGPDGLRCQDCKTPYPCQPRWHADDALSRLEDRAARTTH